MKEKDIRTSSTASRLRQIMEERGLKQVDLVRMVQPYCQKNGIRMNRSDISQYVSGKFEPKSDKLMALGEALGVSPAWLMGLDVPMTGGARVNPGNAEEDAEILILYRMLTDDQRKMIRILIRQLLSGEG